MFLLLSPTAPYFQSSGSVLLCQMCRGFKNRCMHSICPDTCGKRGESRSMCVCACVVHVFLCLCCCAILWLAKGQFLATSTWPCVLYFHRPVPTHWAQSLQLYSITTIAQARLFVASFCLVWYRFCIDATAGHVSVRHNSPRSANILPTLFCFRVCRWILDSPHELKQSSGKASSEQQALFHGLILGAKL